MNCKPGDLAVIVKAITDKHLIGTVVRLTVPAAPPVGFWHYVEEPTLINAFGNEIDALRDEFLSPIRDQEGDESFVVESRKNLKTPQPA